MKRLRARGLQVARGGRVLATGLDVDGAAGQLVVVVGPSGSGKSTLLAVLAGDLAPQAGTLEVDGEPVRPGDARHTARCGRVLQQHSLLPALTAAENVELVLRARGGSARAAAERAEEALGRVGLAEARDRPAGRLSGGQQQRVSVARALAGRPELVLADEPTSELDEANRDAVVAELRREAERGALVLVATHDTSVADAADVLVRLAGGPPVSGSGVRS